MAIDMLIRKKWDKFSLDINFKSQSKRIGILGASGCGKSMTLKSIAGAHTFSSAIHTIIIEKTSRNAPLYALAFSVFNLFFTKETKIFTSIYYLWRHYEYKRT